MNPRGRELNQRALAAMDVVDAGRLQEAEQLYQAILRDTEDCDDSGLPETCGQFAGVKEKLGRLDEARGLYERALREAKRFSDNSENLHVAVYRYFLGEFLLRIDQVDDALAHVEPGLNRDPLQDRFLLITHAKCLWRLDRKGDARAAATRALELAKTPDQKHEAAAQLSALLVDSEDAG